MEKTFCTTREAADLLGVSVGTVQLWVESGLLQAWKTSGGHRRVMRDSIDGLLRRKTAVPATPKSGPVAQEQARPLRVVVVEDDLALQRLYQANLSRWDMGPDVAVFSNPIEALLHIGRTPPDLLITDLHMPGVDGFYMLRALEYAPHVKDTEIVVVTGLDAEDIAQRGGIPSGIEILPKPVPFAKLYAKAQAAQERLAGRKAITSGGQQS